MPWKCPWGKKWPCSLGLGGRNTPFTFGRLTGCDCGGGAGARCCSAPPSLSVSHLAPHLRLGSHRAAPRGFLKLIPSKLYADSSRPICLLGIAVASRRSFDRDRPMSSRFTVRTGQGALDIHIRSTHISPTIGQQMRPESIRFY